MLALYAFTNSSGQPANEIDSALATTSDIVFELDIKFLSILYTYSIARVYGGFGGLVWQPVSAIHAHNNINIFFMFFSI